MQFSEEYYRNRGPGGRTFSIPLLQRHIFAGYLKAPDFEKNLRYCYFNAINTLWTPCDFLPHLDESQPTGYPDQDGNSSINGTAPLAGLLPALCWQVGQPVSRERAGPVEESIGTVRRSVDVADRKEGITMSSWLDAARVARIEDVLGVLGMQSGRGRSFGPCPACGAVHRGKQDRRGPMSYVFRKDERVGWHCWACGASGDAADLVAWRVIGGPVNGCNGRAVELAAWWRSNGGIRVEPGTVPSPVRAGLPDAEEVRDFIRECRPVGSGSPGGLSYLMGRGLDPARIPAGWYAGRHWPTWWPWGDHYPLVVSAVDYQGAVRSVHGRACPEEEGFPKCRWPKDCTSENLFFADPWKGRPLLKGAPAKVAILCEGLTDYLAVASSLRDQKEIAVFGATSGGFSGFHHVKWPWGIRVISATDEDEAGERYAGQIARAVHPIPVERFTVERFL